MGFLVFLDFRLLFGLITDMLDKGWFCGMLDTFVNSSNLFIVLNFCILVAGGVASDHIDFLLDLWPVSIQS